MHLLAEHPLSPSSFRGGFSIRREVQTLMKRNPVEPPRDNVRSLPDDLRPTGPEAGLPADICCK